MKDATIAYITVALGFIFILVVLMIARAIVSVGVRGTGVRLPSLYLSPHLCVSHRCTFKSCNGISCTDALDCIRMCCMRDAVFLHHRRVATCKPCADSLVDHSHKESRLHHIKRSDSKLLYFTRKSISVSTGCCQRGAPRKTPWEEAPIWSQHRNLRQRRWHPRKLSRSCWPV